MYNRNALLDNSIDFLGECNVYFKFVNCGRFVNCDERRFVVFAVACSCLKTRTRLTFLNNSDSFEQTFTILFT